MLGLMIVLCSWTAFLISFGLSWLIDICFHKTLLKFWGRYLAIAILGICFGGTIAIFEGFVALVNLLF